MSNWRQSNMTNNPPTPLPREPVTLLRKGWGDLQHTVTDRERGQARVDFYALCREHGVRGIDAVVAYIMREKKR